MAMANTVKMKQSAVAGKVPTTAQLALGELAINTVDGKLFLKKNVSGTESIVDVTGAAAGVSSFNGRTGAVTPTSADVTGALGFTPANINSPSFTGTPSANGIKFPGAQVSSGDGNTLDDYEEGTWTPVIKFGATTATASVAGWYTKIGNLVTVTGYLSVSNKNGGVGSMGVESFPFVARSGNEGVRGGAAIGYYNGFPSFPFLMLYNGESGATFRRGSDIDFTNSTVPDGSSCWFSYSYLTN
ncbi:hypothetical protein B9Z43_01375 [Limnohabitans sp. MMS-10A-192]|uniref:hypothetical protein n=1 Tax=Limnohabitans sp. MMS-10A-192 TaxID=1835769 RepID=UPI000D355A2B|nr:hypothetical protein [Limnohabitans sp. MMS-10A-192]PUE21860.1 hypothetical protein B9Z43_01375 [Limnohabitans sp. MMS-10A-192]